ncbi:MAG: hypothetical protein FJW92_07540, partial [Actinobacteria bacterium]|nr:hypothetical protein [Actinomycetota bacterium]
VYGDPQRLPLTESHPLSATNPYGQTKLTIELMLRDLARSDDRADKVNALADSQPLCLRTKGRGVAWSRHIALATVADTCAGDHRRVLRGGMVAVRCAWCTRSATEMGVAAAGGGCGCAARGARRKHRLVYQRRRCSWQVVHCGADRVCCSDVANRTRRHRRRGTRLPRAAQVISKGQDPVLLPGTVVNVPLLRESERMQIVEVKGSVAKPALVQHIDDAPLGYYIGVCGGFTPNADLDRVVVILPDGRMLTKEGSGSFNPMIPAESTIVVTTRPMAGAGG